MPGLAWCGTRNLVQLFRLYFVALGRLEGGDRRLAEIDLHKFHRGFALLRIVADAAHLDAKAGSHPILLDTHQGLVIADLAGGNLGGVPVAVCFDALNHGGARSSRVGCWRAGRSAEEAAPEAAELDVVVEGVWVAAGAGPKFSRIWPDSDAQQPCRWSCGGSLRTRATLSCEFQLVWVPSTGSSTYPLGEDLLLVAGGKRLAMRLDGDRKSV